MYLVGHSLKEKRNSTKALEFQKENHDKIVYDMIGIRNCNGVIVPLQINEKDLLYFKLFDPFTGRMITHMGDIYTSDIARVGYEIVGNKAFKMKYRGEYVERILRCNLHSKNNGEMYKFIDVLDNVEYGHNLMCNLNYRIYDYFYDDNIVISMDDFTQEVWIGLKVEEKKGTIINDLVFFKDGKWINYKDVRQKLLFLGNDVNRPPICVIQKYELLGVKFNMITTIEREDTSYNEDESVSESKYTFFITIIVDDVPFIPKGTIDL